MLMKSKKNFDETIDKALREYANANTQEIKTELEFSDTHNQKMKEMFESMRKNNECVQAVSDVKKVNNKIRFVIIRKVAIIIIAVAVCTVVLSTSIKAWKTSDMNTYKKNAKYSWLLSNDTTGLYEDEESSDEEYVKSIFPEIADDIKNICVSRMARIQRIRFDYKGENVIFKISVEEKFAIDSEISYDYSLDLDGLNVKYNKKQEKYSMYWTKEEYSYSMYTSLLMEEILGLIEDINYSKISINF